MERTPSPLRRAADALLVLCFFVGIWLPLADSLLGFAPVHGLTEKRVPAPLPGVPRGVEAAKAFPARFEDWYDDHFGFRGSLIRAHTRLKARWLRTAPSGDVVIGKQGWLYLGVQGAIDQYRAVHPMPPALLARWQRHFEECREYCADRGAEFLFVVAPNKVSIYPEYLPDGIEKVGDESRLDQLLRRLDERSDVRILDLRPALRAAKEKELVYRLHDSHWNEVGAFAAYRRIVEELRVSTPSIPLLDASDFTREIRTLREGDITDLMGIPDLYEEDVVYLRPRSPFPWRKVTEGLVPPSIPWEAQNDDRLMAGLRTAPFASEQDDPGLPRLVMFRDSFATNLLAFLSTGFSRAVYYWQYFFDPEVIIAEGPDVVVQQIIERVLMRPKLPANPPKIRVDFERRRRFRASRDVLLALSRPGEKRAALSLPAPVPAAGRGAILRLAVEARAPAECIVSSVADDDPNEKGTELGRRSLSAGLEIIYFDLAVPAGRHVLVQVEGAAEIGRFELEARETKAPPE